MVENWPANAGDTGLSLVWEDPTRCGATKPLQPQLLSLRSRAWELQLLSRCALEPVLPSERSPATRSPPTATEEYPRLAPSREKPVWQRTPSTAKNKVNRSYTDDFQTNIGSLDLSCELQTHILLSI